MLLVSKQHGVCIAGLLVERKDADDWRDRSAFLTDVLVSE